MTFHIKSTGFHYCNWCNSWSSKLIRKTRNLMTNEITKTTVCRRCWKEYTWTYKIVKPIKVNGYAKTDNLT